MSRHLRVVIAAKKLEVFIVQRLGTLSGTKRTRLSRAVYLYPE
jgi:hypothetical protein